MSRLALVGFAVAVLLAVAGCGGQKTFSLGSTQECLMQKGAHIGGKLDFVAQTATGGAFITKLDDNTVSVVFGQTVKDGQQIELAYQRFAFSNVRAGLSDVLRRNANVVMLWHEHPSDSDFQLVNGCLK